MNNPALDEMKVGIHNMVIHLWIHHWEKQVGHIMELTWPDDVELQKELMYEAYGTQQKINNAVCEIMIENLTH